MVELSPPISEVRGSILTPSIMCRGARISGSRLSFLGFLCAEIVGMILPPLLGLLKFLGFCGRGKRVNRENREEQSLKPSAGVWEEVRGSDEGYWEEQSLELLFCFKCNKYHTNNTHLLNLKGNIIYSP